MSEHSMCSRPLTLEVHMQTMTYRMIMKRLSQRIRRSCEKARIGVLVVAGSSRERLGMWGVGCCELVVLCL
jgi:hypothetical protein